jgi:hypothetical protein
MRRKNHRVKVLTGKTISYLKIIFRPNPPVEDAAFGEADKPRRWILVLSPRHTYSMRVGDLVDSGAG